MAIFECIQKYKEAYSTIIPAEYLIVSSNQGELKDIGQWIKDRDIQAVISVTDSVDGRQHSFTVRIYDKEAIVLLHLIWA